MRWLRCSRSSRRRKAVSCARVPGLHRRAQDLLAAWVEGEFGDTLQRVLKEALPEGVPFLLMCLRGNLYLRVAVLPSPRAGARAGPGACWRQRREAHRIQGRIGEAMNWPTTMASTFQSTRPS